MQLILVSADLMLASAAQGAVDRHGAVLSVAGNVDQACEAAIAAATTQTATVDLAVAVDLRTPGLDVVELVRRVRDVAPDAVILASGPHVQRDSLAAAVAAGCDEVVVRGDFERRLDALLARLTA